MKYLPFAIALLGAMMVSAFAGEGEIVGPIAQLRAEEQKEVMIEDQNFRFSADPEVGKALLKGGKAFEVKFTWKEGKVTYHAQAVYQDFDHAVIRVTGMILAKEIMICEINAKITPETPELPEILKGKLVEANLDGAASYGAFHDATGKFVCYGVRDALLYEVVSYLHNGSMTQDETNRCGAKMVSRFGGGPVDKKDLPK